MEKLKINNMENTNNLFIQGVIVDILPPAKSPQGFIYQQIAIKQKKHKYSNVIAVSVWDFYVNRFNVGDEVKAGLVIEARKKEGLTFYTNKLSAWFIERMPTETIDKNNN